MYYFVIIRVLTPYMSALMAGVANLKQVQNQNKQELIQILKNTFLMLLVAPVFLVRETKIFHFLMDHHFLRMMMNLLSQKSDPCCINLNFYALLLTV